MFKSILAVIIMTISVNAMAESTVRAACQDTLGRQINQSITLLTNNHVLIKNDGAPEGYILTQAPGNDESVYTDAERHGYKFTKAGYVETAGAYQQTCYFILP